MLGDGDENVRWGGWGGDVLCELAAIEEADGEMDGVEGDFGLGEAPPKRFRNLNDIDIAPPPIDWVGGLKNPDNKKIKKCEVMCWSLDFTWASGESWPRLRMKISLGTDIKSH